MAAAVNHLAAEGGGQVVVRDGEVLAFLALPVGGIVADLHPQDMAPMEAGRAQARSAACVRSISARQIGSIRAATSSVTSRFLPPWTATTR
jgi:adenine deaminase